MTVLMLAADFGDFDVMRELLREKTALRNAVAYMQAGIPKSTGGATEEPRTRKNESILSTDQVKVLCVGMREATPIFSNLHSRLVDLEKQIKNLKKISQRKPITRFMLILEHTQSCLVKYSTKPTLIHLVSNHQIVAICRKIHDDLDDLIEVYKLSAVSSIHCCWKEVFESDVMNYKSFIQNYMRLDEKLLFNELQKPEAQHEALILLMFECDNRESEYSEKEMDLIHKIFLYVSSFSKIGISSVPTWFIPPQDVDIQAELACGSYGSVHKARWKGSKVATKCAFLLDAHSRQMFMHEVELWHKLQHPNVVQLYGACHVGNPFFVCEYAANGTLSDFLSDKNDPVKLWEKLYQAACGLRYLHEEHKVVHGDLKCDNILVGGIDKDRKYNVTVVEDGPAKLTDFGLSFVYSKNIKSTVNEVGAVQWKAPEVIKSQSRGTFASDVYSYGMCILQAVKGSSPWGNQPDSTTRKLLELKRHPKRPNEVNDAQWTLISQMIAWEPSDRPTIKIVVETLQEFVQKKSSI